VESVKQSVAVISYVCFSVSVNNNHSLNILGICTEIISQSTVNIWDSRKLVQRSKVQQETRETVHSDTPV